MPAEPASPVLRAAALSVAVSAVVLGLKYAAYLLTHSVALYSDALESIINVVAALAALIALRVAARPADAGHPYGHSKAEYFSAVAEGVLIVLAAIGIIREAVPHLTHPQQADFTLVGLLVSGGASLLNGLWGSHLKRLGAQHRSPALAADGAHMLSDVVTSLGVLTGVILAEWTGWHVLDPILAILVALNILYSGYGLMKDSVGGLMDAAVDPQQEHLIREVVSENAAGAIEVHDLRTRHAGHVTFIEFHLVVPGSMTVEEAHHICDRLEEALQQAIPGSNVLIHAEPQEMAKHHGVLVI